VFSGVHTVCLDARRVILQTGGKQPEAEALYPKIG
jgi:hypothetical protein